MTGNATVLTRGNAAARTRENREYVRSQLKVRQPQFAVALESATRELLRDHRNGRRLVGEEYLMTDGSVMTSSATTGRAGASQHPLLSGALKDRALHLAGALGIGLEFGDTVPGAKPLK